jgi:hypothetical protein
MCTRGHACAGGLGRCPFESATLAPHDVADVADLVSPAEARRVKPAAPSSKGLARGGWSQPPTVCESRRHRVGGLAFVREESRIGLQVRVLLRRRDGSAGRGLGIVTPEVWRGERGGPVLDDVLGRAGLAMPASLLAEASAFELGESLLAGRIVAHPTLARSGRRLSREGGDVPPTSVQRLGA